MPLLFIIVVVALSQGCAVESAETDVRVQTLRSDTTSESSTDATIDLTMPTHGYVFEDGAALDPQLRARVTLVCPNGVEMPFENWFGAQDEVVQNAFEGRRTSMAATLDTAIGALRDADPECPCDIECSYCPDGTVICAFDCAEIC